MSVLQKRILIGVGAAFGVLIALAVAFVAFFPKDAAIREAVRRIDEATGRHLTIAGPVNITIFPALGFSAERASLSNPAGFGTSPFLAADKIVFAVKVLPLLSGNIQVQRLILEGAELNLAAKPDGSANWTFPTEQNAQQQTTLEDLRLDEVRLSRGRISFAGGDGGEPMILENVEANLALESLAKPAQMHAEFDYRHERLKVDGQVGLPRAVLEKHQTPITATLASTPLNANLQGAFNAENGEITGRLQANGASMRALMAWLGSPLPDGGTGFGAWTVTAALTHLETRTSLRQSAIKLDAIDARGDLDIVTDARGRMTVTGALSAPAIDLNPYLPPPAQGAGQAGVNASTAWATDALDFSGLKAMDAHLTLTTAALTFQKIRFSNVAMDLRIAHGAADARLPRFGFYGGTGAARMIVDASGATPRIGVELTANNVQAEPLLTDAIGFDRIAGRGQVATSLTGAGGSQAALMRSLGGSASFTFNDGKYKGVNLAQIARTIQTVLTGTGGASGEASTDFAELGAHFAVAHGVAATQDLHLLNPFVRLDGSGVIDLGQQTLDMRLAPRAVGSAQGQGGQASLQGLGIPFRVYGPWAHVRFAPALGDALKNELSNRARSVLQNQPADSTLGRLGSALFGTSPSAATTTSTTTAAPPSTSTTTAAPQHTPAQPPPRTPEQRAQDALQGLFGKH